MQRVLRGSGERVAGAEGANRADMLKSQTLETRVTISWCLCSALPFQRPPHALRLSDVWFLRDCVVGDARRMQCVWPARGVLAEGVISTALNYFGKSTTMAGGERG